MKHILKCKDCSLYTLKPRCPSCGGETFRPIPPKYSPEDKYGEYRRKVKRKQLIEAGLL